MVWVTEGLSFIPASGGRSWKLAAGAGDLDNTTTTKSGRLPFLLSTSSFQKYFQFLAAVSLFQLTLAVATSVARQNTQEPCATLNWSNSQSQERSSIDMLWPALWALPWLLTMFSPGSEPHCCLCWWQRKETNSSSTSLKFPSCPCTDATAWFCAPELQGLCQRMVNPRRLLPDVCVDLSYGTVPQGTLVVLSSCPKLQVPTFFFLKPDCVHVSDLPQKTRPCMGVGC